MEQQITGLKTDMGYLIQFPDNTYAEKITGTMFLNNTLQPDLNFKQPLVLTDTNVLIPEEKFSEGKWEVIMEWASDGVTHTYKQIVIF